MSEYLEVAESTWFEVSAVCSLLFELDQPPAQGPRDFESHLEICLELEAETLLQAEEKARDIIEESVEGEGLGVLLGSDEFVSAHFFSEPAHQQMMQRYLGDNLSAGLREFQNLGELRLLRVDFPES